MSQRRPRHGIEKEDLGNGNGGHVIRSFLYSFPVPLHHPPQLESYPFPSRLCSSSFAAMQANFLLLAICVAFYFFLSSSSSASGWNAARIYFDLFSLILAAVALLFLDLWVVDPARRARAVSSLLVPLILAFDFCGVLFDGAGGGLDLYFDAYLLFLASVAAVFARVCGAEATPFATAALLVFLFLKLGAAVVFSCYLTEGIDGGDADLPQFVLLAAGAMFTLAYL